MTATVTPLRLAKHLEVAIVFTVCFGVHFRRAKSLVLDASLARPFGTFV